MVQFVDCGDGGVACVRGEVGLCVVGCEAAGTAGAPGADERECDCEEMEYRFELGRVLALLGLGDQRRVEGGKCDDAHHV